MIRSFFKMKVVLMLILLTFVKPYNSKDYDDKLRSYSPDWEDLDTRPIPQWFEGAKIGVLLHWGLYSVPSFGSEWFWNKWVENNDDYTNFMQKNYPPNFTYQQFAPMFKAEFFDPNEWATLFVQAGAKYVVLTGKHYDGYTLFPSKRSPNWNAPDVGPRRDLVGDLAASVRDAGLKFGVYYSLLELYNPIYTKDKKTDFTLQTYVENTVWPDLKQLINDYRPSVLWVDGDWEAPDDYWRSKEFLAWLYSESPVADEIVTNDRWGMGSKGKHGDFYNSPDKHHPRSLLKHKWEEAFSMDSESWGYRRNMKLSEVLSLDKLLYQIVSTVSYGGNVLINVGPTKEGTIDGIFQDRLLSLGAWLDINGEAIYKSSPWRHQRDSTNENVWYTCHMISRSISNPPLLLMTAIYAIVLKWPEHSHGVHRLLAVTDIVGLLQRGNLKIQLLGNPDIVIRWEISDGRAWITMPDEAVVKSTNAWVLKIWGHESPPTGEITIPNKFTSGHVHRHSARSGHLGHLGAQCPGKSSNLTSKFTAVPLSSPQRLGNIRPPFKTFRPPSDMDKKEDAWKIFKKFKSLILQ